ncbi:MAG TPA: outer membrane beta-barrel protein [Gemmatimonadota bacterium]
MVLRRAVGIAFASVALIAATRESLAQPITVTSNGQPLAGAQISAMINGIKSPLGVTNTAGRVAIDVNALNITKGTEVTIWIKTCEDGTTQVILVPQGEQGECVEEGAQAGERCGCRRAGTIIWGDGPVTIDVGTGTVTQTGGGGGTLSGRALLVGLGFDLRQMLNLEDVLGEIPGGSDESATSWAPGFQVLSDWRFSRFVSLGIAGAYSRMDTEVRFPAGVQTGDLNYYEYGVNAKLLWPGRRIEPYITFSLDRTINKGDFELVPLVGTGLRMNEHRVHHTRRDGIGAGLDYYPGSSSNWGLRFEGLYSSTFDDADADEHIRWKAALLWRAWGATRRISSESGGMYE